MFLASYPRPVGIHEWNRCCRYTLARGQLRECNGAINYNAPTATADKFVDIRLRGTIKYTQR